MSSAGCIDASMRPIQQVVARPATERCLFMSSSTQVRSGCLFRWMSIIHRYPRPSLLISNDLDASPPSRSNSHIRIIDPQRVKPRTKRRVSCALNTSRAYLSRWSQVLLYFSSRGLLLARLEQGCGTSCNMNHCRLPVCFVLAMRSYTV